MAKAIDTLEHPAERPHGSRVDALRALHWLALGWRDFAANPGPAAAQGAILAALGWLILMFCSTQINLLAAAISVFLLVAPVLGAGFYELSRRRERGQAASFDAALEGATARRWPLARLGAVLGIVAIAWVLTSNAMFAGSFMTAPPPPGETFYRTIVDWAGSGFLMTYMVTGALFALVAFVLSATSAPMLFDRDIGVRQAIGASVRTVAAHPLPMLVWATVIAILAAVGFATLLIGLIVILPWLGHATWHAYRELTR